MSPPLPPFESSLEATVAGLSNMEYRGGSVYPADNPSALVYVGTDAVLLGRDAACQMMLDDPHVSAVHAEMVATERGVRLRDLGSRNGTFLGGVRLGEGFLTSRTVFQVGKTQIVFEPSRPEWVSVAEQSSFGPLAGENALMRALFSRLEKIAATDLTVLIGGETGCGKEVVAQAIHSNSPRAAKPFVVVDCGSIPGSLAEATLFGHEKGAFTGATDRRVSPFVEADGGTIFLDELGELPLDLQPKLLRVLAERRIKSVGGTKYLPVNVRVLAATRRDLTREVNEGRFRSDLFFRIAQVRIDLPPLRARLDDVPVLIRHMLAEVDAPEAYERISPEQMQRLMRYDWPGNVRELKNAVSVALALADDGPLDIVSHLGTLADVGRTSMTPPPPAAVPGDLNHKNTRFKEAKQTALSLFERSYFSAMVDDTGGNISEIARRSGLERAHVRMYLRKHNLNPKGGG
ncbi:MAG TPA: sigma 54-interacting transcriptional regulator [Polyangiaceae bacterium]|nr:sigma 54-interacting transcriptional regulator [Polyangiaceae bacterium]